MTQGAITTATVYTGAICTATPRTRRSTSSRGSRSALSRAGPRAGPSRQLLPLAPTMRQRSRGRSSRPAEPSRLLQLAPTRASVHGDAVHAHRNHLGNCSRWHQRRAGVTGRLTPRRSRVMQTPRGKRGRAGIYWYGEGARRHGQPADLYRRRVYRQHLLTTRTTQPPSRGRPPPNRHPTGSR